MAAPNAPVPLYAQIKAGTNVTVTVTLRGMGPQPTLTDGGATYNSGDPSCTFTIPVPPAVPGGQQAVTPSELVELLHDVEDMWQAGTATAA